MAAVLLVSCLVICTSCACLYGITKSKSQDSAISLIVALVALCAVSFHWLARPHLFTLVFAAIYYHLLEMGTVKTKRMMIALPLLMVLWTNVHGGFLAGPVSGVL
jgi:uncharacterized membrane protein